MIRLVFTFIFLFLSTGFFALDTNKLEHPVLKDTTKKFKLTPGKTALLSTLLPGLGQFANKKYWKIPIVYSAIGVAVYLAVDNNKQVNTFLNALVKRQNGEKDAYDGIYTNNQLEENVNFYQNNRDLSIIFGALLYLANILDAYVDAHLLSFNVSDNLSLNVNFQPSQKIKYFSPPPSLLTNVRVSLNFKF